MMNDMKPLVFSYEQPPRDVLTVEGMRYSGALFRLWSNAGFPVGTLMRIVKRENGVMTVEVVSMP